MPAYSGSKEMSGLYVQISLVLAEKLGYSVTNLVMRDSSYDPKNKTFSKGGTSGMVQTALF